jgi:lysophospholipase L1-like esterase
MKAILAGKNTLQMACGGSTVFNQAITASVMKQWSDENYEKLKEALGVSTGWTHVWVSLGGNDFSQLKCADPQGTIKKDLTALIAQIHAHPNAKDAKVVLTYYAVGALDDTCKLEDVRQAVYVPMKEIANSNDKVIFSSMEAAAGGVLDPSRRTNCYNGILTPDVLTPQATCAPQGACSQVVGKPPCRGKWNPNDPDRFNGKLGVSFLHDGGHLNVEGYKKAWEQPAMQAAFGCWPKGTVPPPRAGPRPRPRPPVATCTDNDAALSSYASTKGFNNVTSCGQAASFCGQGDVNVHCKATCKVGACR